MPARTRDHGTGASASGLLRAACAVVASNAVVPARCTASPRPQSEPSRSIWARTSFSAFTRIVRSRGTCWISGLRSIACRCTRPPCTWPRPSRFPGTEKRNPYGNPFSPTGELGSESRSAGTLVCGDITLHLDSCEIHILRSVLIVPTPSKCSSTELAPESVLRCSRPLRGPLRGAGGETRLLPQPAGLAAGPLRAPGRNWYTAVITADGT